MKVMRPTMLGANVTSHKDGANHEPEVLLVALLECPKSAEICMYSV